MDDFKSAVLQYKSIKEEISFLTSRQAEAKKVIQKYLEEHGEEDGRGHIIYEDGDLKATNQKRVSKSLDMDVAEALLEEKGLVESCVKMVPVLDEDAIMAAHYEGKLSEAEIDSMFPAKVSYALII